MEEEGFRERLDQRRADKRAKEAEEEERKVRELAEYNERRERRKLWLEHPDTVDLRHALVGAMGSAAESAIARPSERESGAADAFAASVYALDTGMPLRGSGRVVDILKGGRCGD